jgi:PAS domain S-box-containing protein
VTGDTWPDIFPTTRKVLNATPAPVVITDTSLRIMCLNQHAEDALDLTEADLLGAEITDIFAELHRQRASLQAHETIELANEDNQLKTNELLIQRSDGTTFIADVGMRPLDLDGRCLLVCTFRDISAHKDIETELRTNQLLLAEAQRVAQLGSWRWDIAEDQVSWSQELYRIYGLGEHESPISFERFHSLIHPSDQDRVRAIINESVENHSSFEIEHRILRPDGSIRVVYGQGAPRVDDTGALVSLIGTSQDVTERKANEAQAFQLALEQAARQEAERTKERFQFLAEVSQAVSASLDFDETLNRLTGLMIPKQADWCSINTTGPNGEIQRLAVAHRDTEKQRILETIRARNFIPHGDAQHPLNRVLTHAKPELIRHVADDALRRMARNEDHYELLRTLDVGSVMMVPLIARGRAFGVITLGMSSSRRPFTEEDLQLAVEVAHRAAVSIDNAHLYREAQNAARAREEFVSLVSHELKTPLTVIKGYIQVLERYLERPDWQRERIRTTRERLSTQVERLELLVADILDVSRIQRGRLDLNMEPGTDLVELANYVVERFDDAIERKPTHELIVDADQPVHGRWDPLRLDQVFSNLLSNALKYSPDGGAIDVRIRQQGQDAIVEVQDRGVGISEPELRKLFQPFQRGAVAARGISGTGLGLYITRQIIEQHGGSIDVESSAGEYTMFRIRLPLEPEYVE